jgi:predicted dehydrogenase
MTKKTAPTPAKKTRSAKASKTIKLGIIGTGGMAGGHASAFAKIEGVELSACLDVVPEKARAFAEKHSVAHVAESIDQLLERVDAVCVVTPDRFHGDASLRILQAGKHLLCEKPLTVTLAEARTVAAAAIKASANGVQHMVNFSYRRSAAMQEAIALVRAGKLGQIRHAHSFYLQTWLSSDVWGGWAQDAWLWRLQTAAGSGGVLGDIGCHILDLTTAVAGEVKAIRCDLRTFPKIHQGKEVTELDGKRLDANDSAIIELEFAAGGIGVVHTSRWATGHKNHLRCEVHGTEGALMFDLDTGYDQINLCLGKDAAKAEWTKKDLDPKPSNYERFINAIASGKTEQPDVLRGAQVQAYLDACERSAKSGRWETVAPWV